MKTAIIWSTVTRWMADVADPVSKWATIAAIVVAGVWAYFQFWASGARDWAINMSITTEVIPYHDNLALLVIHVHPANPRNIAIDLDSKRDVYQVTVKEIPEGKPIGTVLNPNDTVTTGINKTIPMMPHDGYTFLPGASFTDSTSLVVPYGVKLWVGAELDYDGDYVGTDDIIVVAPPKTSKPS